MTGLEMAMGVGATVATVISTFVGLKLAPIEKEMDALSKRIDGIHADSKDEREKLESRLQDIEKTFIDRAELNRAIESFGARSDANTARIEAVVVALGVKVDHLAERVIKVEST